MIHIGFLLHIYQPPCQTYSVLKNIIKECYQPIFNIIKNNKNSKITLNINGSLTELLKLYEHEDILSLINELNLNDKLRFTGSGMYHPILPILPVSEIERQIELNEEYNSQVFTNYYYKKGFFPPEMSISSKVLDIVSDKNYSWIIADGVACPEEWPTDKYYRYKNLVIFFRDTIISNHIAFNEITPQGFLDKVKNLFEQDFYIIIALDGETFGHHIKNYDKIFLDKVIKLINKSSEFELVFIDELIELYPSSIYIKPHDSSWSTTGDDLRNNIPYPLWANPTNRFHIIQNRIQEQVYELIKLIEMRLEDLKLDKHLRNEYKIARNYLDKGEFSCKLWWSCPQHFDSDIIISGNQFLIKSAVHAFNFIVNSDLDEIIKIESRKIYDSIITEYQFLLREIGTHIDYTYKFGHF